jgi:hypothetical protein
VFADHTVDVSAGGGQHEARGVPCSFGAARLDDDTVGRDVQPDVVVLAERRGVGEVGVDGADPEPVLQVR